jgi:hypothetical protein
MSRLSVCLLLFWGLLLSAAGVAQAQRRGHQGQALVVRPSRARYVRAPVFRDYYKPPRRSHFRYAPSYHAYYNRGPYRPRVRYSRHPAKRALVAGAHPGG